jgi:hypothetical protein
VRVRVGQRRIFLPRFDDLCGARWVAWDGFYYELRQVTEKEIDAMFKKTPNLRGVPSYIARTDYGVIFFPVAATKGRIFVRYVDYHEV